MKLWLKVYLCAVPLSLLVLVLCGAWMLHSSFQTTMAREKERALADHALVVGALDAHLSGIGSGAFPNEAVRDQAVAAAARSYARYYTGGDVALGITDQDGEALFSGLTGGEQAAMALAPQVDERVEVVRHAEGRTLLFVSGWLVADSASYRLDLMRDISPLMEDTRALSRQMAIMMGAAGALLAGGLCALIGGAMRPLGALAARARSLARGDYGARIASGSGEVGQLARAFNDMADAVTGRMDELERSARDRDQFIANLAHEMKTPMTTILGYAQLLERATLTDGQKAQALTGILQAGARLDGLSKHLLQLQRIKRGQAQVADKWADVGALLGRVADALALKAEQAEVRLEVRCELDAFPLDPDLMELMLTNLADNAIKASPPGGAVTLSARAAGAGAEFAVTDRGRGIPQGHMDRVKLPFYMVDPARARSQQGAGLGLTLCDAIAAAHGARLEIDSREGEGTVARVRFDKSFTTGRSFDEGSAV